MSEIETASTTPPSPVEVSGKTSDVEKSERPQPLANNGAAANPLSYVPQNDEEYNVSFKTWVVVWVNTLQFYCSECEQELMRQKILAWSYGISFWIVPTYSGTMFVIATEMGDVNKAAWYIPVYTMCVTMAFM